MSRERASVWLRALRLLRQPPPPCPAWEVKQHRQALAQKNTMNVAPGERWDVLVKCDEPGVWAFHCHILTHAESAHGMFGMVTVLIIE
ncbi:MAG TPA: multicopper oxidase domain-containing protein [Anaerolineales bacterium]|nr:multicopper oxidase domain-containing protein [Anaerolineales bacterium]